MQASAVLSITSVFFSLSVSSDWKNASCYKSSWSFTKLAHTDGGKKRERKKIEREISSMRFSQTPGFSRSTWKNSSRFQNCVKFHTRFSQHILICTVLFLIPPSIHPSLAHLLSASSMKSFHSPLFAVAKLGLPANHGWATAHTIFRQQFAPLRGKLLWIETLPARQPQ